MTKEIIDPFSRKVVKVESKDLLDPKERDVAPGLKISYLEQFRLNLVVTLGSPWRVKFDIIERNIGILNMIENDPKKLHDSRWMYVYDKVSNTVQRELEKLDKVWKDLSTKRASQDQLRAFQNIEIFIEFLTKLIDILIALEIDIKGATADILIKAFMDFLKEKDMFLE